MPIFTFVLFYENIFTIQQFTVVKLYRQIKKARPTNVLLTCICTSVDDDHKSKISINPGNPFEV